jgi:ligand-binding sensor domain-containing protein
LNMLRKFCHLKASMLTRALGVCILLTLSSLFFVSCDSGLFSNANWQASGLQNQQLRVLAVSSKDSSTLYVGNVQGNIFMSSDAGQKWTEQSSGLPLPDAIHALSFDISGLKLYAATEKGLFMRAEGATLWQKITAAGLPSTSFTALTFLSDAPNVIYVGTSGQGVFVSHDAGVSWRASNSGLPQGIVVNDLAVDPVAHQIWAATSVGVYRSEESGAAWQSFNNGLPPARNVNTIVSAATAGGAPGTLYMGTNQGIFLSKDSGVHWTTNPEALSGVATRRILLDFRSPTASVVYAATNVGVFRSIDTGQSWGAVASGLPKNASSYALAIGAVNNAQVYAAGNGLYEFPGTGSSIAPTRIFTYLVIAAFFYLLYRLGTRGRRTGRGMLNGQRPPVPTPPDDSAHTA